MVIGVDTFLLAKRQFHVNQMAAPIRFLYRASSIVLGSSEWKSHHNFQTSFTNCPTEYRIQLEEFHNEKRLLDDR